MQSPCGKNASWPHWPPLSLGRRWLGAASSTCRLSALMHPVDGVIPAGRDCERELTGLRMSCFSTPSQLVGEVHPFYQWMVNGAELFRRLAPHYRLYDGRTPLVEPLCFETFPQAIACCLAGKRLSAKHKRIERRRLVEQAIQRTDALTSIDEIDAALCALAAQDVLAGSFNVFGDAAEGFILVPNRRFNFLQESSAANPIGSSSSTA